MGDTTVRNLSSLVGKSEGTADNLAIRVPTKFNWFPSAISLVFSLVETIFHSLLIVEHLGYLSLSLSLPFFWFFVFHLGHSIFLVWVAELCSGKCLPLWKIYSRLVIEGTFYR